VPSREAQGIYFRDDGEVIPVSLLEETVEAYYDFDEDICQIDREDEADINGCISGNWVGASKTLVSRGDALDVEFENWLRTEKVKNVYKTPFRWLV
jgi:hypothetical protein